MMHLLEVLSSALNPLVLLMSFVGVNLGLIVGAIPGLGVVMAMTVLLPFTFGMDPLPALVMLSGIYVGGMAGDVIPAVLMGIPGTPGSAADVLDGVPLARQGRASEALNLSIFGSFIGGLLSLAFFLICSAPLVKLSVNFGPPEYFWLAILGLTTIASVSDQSMAKGMIAGALGVLISCVGMDDMTGQLRFTSGNPNLFSGIPLIPPLVGLFAFSRVLEMIREKDGIKGDGTTCPADVFNIRENIPKVKDITPLFKTFFRGGIAGTLIGVLPGAGGDIASWVAYSQEKKVSKHPEKFGKGAIEGLVAAETGNSAVVGGSLIPLLALGIPGSAAAAVIFAGINVQGLAPGLELFSHHATLVYSLIAGIVLANVMTLLSGLVLRGMICKVLFAAPNYLLVIVITTCSILGTYAIQNSIFHVYLMVIFGGIGFLMKRFQMPLAAMVLGIILGPMLETGLRQSLTIFSETPWLIFTGNKGISLFLVMLLLVALVYPLLKKMRAGKKSKEKPV